MKDGEESCCENEAGGNVRGQRRFLDGLAFQSISVTESRMYCLIEFLKADEVSIMI